jgi:hypothetical protein
MDADVISGIARVGERIIPISRCGAHPHKKRSHPTIGA